MTETTPKGYAIAINRLPTHFPTHLHEKAFWESLGRAVATFGFLEEVLEKAIFSLTTTRTYEESEIAQAYDEWVKKLERAISDPLGNLIDVYAKAVREHPSVRVTNFDDLVSDLRRVCEMRNILCHGSWRPPDAMNASIPFFVNRRHQVVDTAMDCDYLVQVQQHTAELACWVVNTVITMGWQFPGSTGPGKPIW